VQRQAAGADEGNDDAATGDASGRRAAALTSRLPRLSFDPILGLVDLDRVLEHVDVNALVERVDVNALLERVDVNAVIARVDLNALLERLDVDDLVQRSDLGSILIDSTGSVGTRLLDALRSQAVGLDQLIERAVNRLLRRDAASVPDGPRLLVEPRSP